MAAVDEVRLVDIFVDLLSLSLFIINSQSEGDTNEGLFKPIRVGEVEETLRTFVNHNQSVKFEWAKMELLLFFF